MQRLKVDDKVIVISGSNKGQTGSIVALTKDGRVVIEGVNMRKHHRSPRKYREPGLIEKEAPIHASNVALIDPETQKPTRVRAGTDENGKKVRIAVKSGANLDAKKKND